MTSVSPVSAMNPEQVLVSTRQPDGGFPPDGYPRDKVPGLLLAEYIHWFVNRRDFYIQNAYLVPADFEHGTACMRVSTPLTDDHVLRHIVGQHTIGLYALEPQFSSCKWFALDGDYEDKEQGIDAKNDLENIAEAMREDGLFPAFEESRRGAHLWLLCAEPLPALQGRIYLYTLLDRLGYAIRGPRKNLEGIEVFPKQESLKDGQFGNGLRGPFGIHRKSMRRYWFRDAEPTLQDQFSYIRQLPRLTRAKLDELTEGLTMPEDLLQKDEPRLGATSTSKFDFREFIGPGKLIPEPSRKASTKGDFFIQCPCCAASGRDNGKNNLHVTPGTEIQEGTGPPELYCFACQSSYKDLWAAFSKLGGRPKQSTSIRKFE